MSIRAVIWDIGGVIVRTEDRAPRTALGQELGMSYAEIDQLVFGCESAKLASLGKMDEQEHWRRVCDTLSLPQAESPRLQARFWEGDQVDYELVEYIKSLKPRYQTAVLSNAWSGMRAYIEETWRIHEAFDRLFISAELGLAKPDPRIYPLITRELGVLPEEAVFIDDFIENIQAAQAAGLHGVLFQNPQQARTDLDHLLAQYEKPDARQ
jgi:glucose-1-phosphatase